MVNILGAIATFVAKHLYLQVLVVMLLIHAYHKWVDVIVNIRLPLVKVESIRLGPSLQEHFDNVIEAQAAGVLERAHFLDLVPLVLPQD